MVDTLLVALASWIVLSMIFGVVVGRGLRTFGQARVFRVPPDRSVRG